VEQRSQHRIRAAVPVEIRGVDARGDSFQESTEALEVSRRGLSLLTRRDLPLYATLTVVIPGRGPTLPNQGPTDFFASATVVRIQKEGELNHISIRFMGATLPTYTSETG
jgi:PilZ domain-containing protein